MLSVLLISGGGWAEIDIAIYVCFYGELLPSQSTAIEVWDYFRLMCVYLLPVKFNICYFYSPLKCFSVLYNLHHLC